MRKLLFISVFGLLISGCMQATPEVSWGKSLYYEFTVGSEEENNLQTFYFQYPDKAEVVFESKSGMISYEGCEVKFSDRFSDEQAFSDLYTKNDRKVEDISYESWYSGEKMVLYKLYLESYGYSFWCYDQEGVLACKELVEQISATFTDRPLYINERFGFSFELLMDYKMEQMPSGEGAIQKKWFEEDGYAVQISVYAEDNIMEYQDALALYRDKYEGFDSDFGEVDGKTAVYVNEGQGNDAVRHMIMMSRDGSTIIRAELRVPSFYFTRHKEEFDEFTRKIKAD